MACHFAYYYHAFSLTPLRDLSANNTNFRPSRKYKPLLFSSINSSSRASYGTFVSELRGWYIKDDVVAEWKKVRDDMCLHVHCYVSGPSLLRDLAAEFRYHIFTKEMPLVLKAVLHGDSMLFRENPELMNALVRVYFHSSSKIYNRMECWGPLKDAAEGRQEDSIQGLLTANKEGYHSPKKLARPKSIFQALFAFLL
ncbi:Magnesium dechelatase SGRL [Citrus sinensis]|uniref:Magnesium dechelatase SGRL n=1 Tax=Citrus sinensis TaxID=2711 RepID=A0ACB8KS91_CITSI|nr:Magnesium dechelatase SGRL [Citrus sinensis]